MTNIWHTVTNNDQILQLIELDTYLSSLSSPPNFSIFLEEDNESVGVHTATFLRTSQHFTLGYQGVVKNKNSLPQAFSFQVAGKCVAVEK